MNIIPCVGFDKVVFGMDRAQVKGLLGTADSLEQVEFPEGESTESWIYNELAVDLNFDSDCDFRLTRITFFAPSASVEDHAVVGMSERQLLAAFPDLFLEEEGGEYGKSYEYIEKEISFFVVDGKVESFTLVVPSAEDGRGVQWPS